VIDRPATLDSVRRSNLSRVLGLVHHDGPQSRARLTLATGLNRSTIAALAAELADLGLVDERAPDPTNRVGRPSPVVVARPDVLAIAVNPEIDAVTIAAVGLNARIVARKRIETDGLVTPEQTAVLVAETLARWRGAPTPGDARTSSDAPLADAPLAGAPLAGAPLAGARLVGVGLAVPGLVRGSDGLVRLAPHLEWMDAPVGALVEAATGLPVVVGNDATLGAVAEHLFGAGRGVDDLVYLNGGASGIGGGLIVHGRSVGGAGGYAGEFGQNRPGIDDRGDRLVPGGVLEDEVSRARLLEIAGLHSADEPTLAAALTAASGDPAVAAELARQRRILGTALANAVNVLNPSVVIVGGFLATLAEHDPEALREAIATQAMPAAGESVELRLAALGEDRLMIGAAEAAFAPLLADPLGVGAR
jgi:predicted NBD/HSP70 family sugar kinase